MPWNEVGAWLVRRRPHLPASVSGRADGVTVLVETDPSHPALGDKASVAVTSIDGPVATSYPVQGKAQALVIVR
jgi:hypothetical protein